MSKDKLYQIQVYLEQFLIFSFGGWVYESIWCSVIEQNVGFVNRGFLFGPWLPIYGIGLSLILYCFRKWKPKHWVYVFVAGILIAVGCELIGSYVMEHFTGSFLWDYSDEFLNFQGRIALKPALYFGFLILLAYYKILPFVEKYQKKYKGYFLRNMIFGILLLLFVVDLGYHIFKL